MSDLNLFTVEVWDGAIVDGYGRAESYVPDDMENGTYVLVPVDAMEKVWWCRVQDTMWPQSVDGRCDHDEEGECVSAWRWLVSTKEDE